MEDKLRASGPDAPQQTVPDPTNKPRKRLRVLLVVVLIAAAIIIVAFLAVAQMVRDSSGGGPNKENNSAATDDPAAAAKLFDALGKGAAQQNIRVAQLRKTFATKADLASNTDPGIVQSSVAEIVGRKFRALYAQRNYDSDVFRMQRCQDGTTYIDGQGASMNRTPPKTLAEANEYLKQMYQVTQNLTFIVCPHVGVMPGGSLDLAPARLSDGIMPVTFDAAQAGNWKSRILAANLFSVKDEGLVTHEGKQLRKLSFVPANNRTDTNKKLYDIFYETGEIEKIKRDHPTAEWQYEHISINPVNGGSIQGFYLIDETTGLPAYSELEGLHTDRRKDAAVSKANLGRTKQSYAYPATLSIELTSPLEFIE